MEEQYGSFGEFWPFYLSQHQNRVCRSLHFLGTTLAIVLFIAGLATHHQGYLFLAPFCGYFFAWSGHFLFEKNRPATFRYPLWSLRGDFRMLKLFCQGKLSKELAQ